MDLTGWKNYVVDGYKYIVNETWQLAADAKNEAGNLVSEVYSKFSIIISPFLKSVNLFEK